MKKPLGMAMISYRRIDNQQKGRVIDQMAASNLDENELVQKHLSSHIRNGEHDHEHQRAHHHALRPCLERQMCWV